MTTHPVALRCKPGFTGLQLAGGDAVNGAQGMGEQPGRARIRVGAMSRPALVDGGEVAVNGRIQPALQPGHAAFGFTRALSLGGVQTVQAAPGVGIQREAGRRLEGQRIAHVSGNEPWFAVAHDAAQGLSGKGEG